MLSSKFVLLALSVALCLSLVAPTCSAWKLHFATDGRQYAGTNNNIIVRCYVGNSFKSTSTFVDNIGRGDMEQIASGGGSCDKFHLEIVGTDGVYPAYLIYTQLNTDPKVVDLNSVRVIDFGQVADNGSSSQNCFISISVRIW
eukprot:TRINITY_DN2861_c0_g1_i2.p1 TRINITY_DN2861_c0_g1~~TRINITY_DN2861_c0_g1_i2.p1  ORF type:complete len:150 (+),score=16.26 TRINITY_DN2861_c0_g1_i2:24-452(+)